MNAQIGTTTQAYLTRNSSNDIRLKIYCEICLYLFWVIFEYR